MWLVQWLKSNSERNEFGVPIRNFGKVTESVYRGALPRPAGYRALVERLGVRRVCSLTEGARERHREEALGAGVREWLHIPFSDREAPRPERVREWLAVMRTAPREGSIYTHCMGGRHRTGVLIAVLRVTDCGWTTEQALSEMMRFGYYDALGHTPVREWFVREFDPRDYADAGEDAASAESSQAT